MECFNLNIMRKKITILILFFVVTIPLHVYAAKYLFPQAKDYPYGIQPDCVSQKEMNRDCLKAYNDFIMHSVISKGCPSGVAYRVHIGKAVVFKGTEPYDTYSEGIAWGMLLSVIMDNGKNHARNYFNAFNAYRKHYRKANGLMNWHIGSDGIPKDTGIAVEADENMAMALMLAHYKWGSSSEYNYKKETTELMNALMDYCVQKSEMFMKPGDTWGGYDLVHPCNFDVCYYRDWADFTEDTNWLQVRNTSYNILNKIFQKYRTGFLPHWCDFEGNKTSGKNEYFSDFTFESDALQTAFKIPLDFLLNGNKTNQLSYKIPDSLSYSIRRITGNNPEKIVASAYKLEGTLINPTFLQVAFLGAFGVSSMVSPEHQQWCNDIYTLLRNQKTGGQWGYYRDIIRLLSMIIMSGNFPQIVLN